MAKANFIFTNARAYTLDASTPYATTVAVAGNKILFVGNEANSKDFRSADTKLIDCQQKTLLPGIIDSHFHLMWGALNLANIQLEDITGLDNLRREVQAFKQKHPEKKFLRGSSVSYDVLPKGERLTRHHIDQIEPDLPLILVAFDFHSAWCNTAALEAAGILRGAELTSNAEVVMGNDGLATGELREFQAMDLVLDLINNPSEVEKNNLVQQAIHLANSYGITSIHNMNGDRDEFAFYQKLDETQKLNLRIYVPFRMYPTDPLSVLKEEALYLKNTYQSEKLKAGALKLFMDGVIESFTGFMLEPYINNPSTRGEAIFEAEHFNEICIQADALGLQIAVHAIGDAAVRRTLDGYEAALKANGKRDSRHRIEHIEFLHPDDLPRFSQLSVIASVQPYHCTRPELSYLMSYLDFIPESRYQDCFRWKSLRESGANLSFGSDWPVVSMNPFLGFDAAVNRQAWQAGLASESQSLENTLNAYSKDAAYVEFAENQKGQLKVGMLADLALLSEDVFSLPKTELKTLQAELTMCDGQIVFER